MEISLSIRLVNFILLLCIYFPLLISALISLRKRRLSSRHTAFWVFIILFFPFFGAIAFWIVNPQNNSANTRDIEVLNA
ncbi:PLDc N-terminal domain-containing protein [Thermodesulfobacteriota bacterium]